MSRPKSFDPDAVVTAATELFWRHGFHNTSLTALESHLSVGRKSLYDTFGDKRGLFLRAIEGYTRVPFPITRRGAGWSAIEAMFRQAPFFEEGRRGCLMANTTLEFGTEEDDAVSALIERHFARLERGFAAALDRAIADGDVKPLGDVPAAARYLTLSLQGVAVMAKSGAPREAFEGAIDMVLNALRPT